MAKAATAADTKQEQEEPKVTLQDLFASFSEEEMAEFHGLSGQAANSQQKIPILKVNYCDIPDRTGREIKKGNFVLSQDSSEIEIEVVDEEGNKSLEKRVEDIGIDLGKAPKITILTFGFRYSYYHSDAKKRCGSQLVLDRRLEKPVGNNLGHECSTKGACPRRGEGVDRAEKCSCQWVVFVKVPTEDGVVDALMYVKGASYMPFSDYVKSAGITPLFFAPTKLTTKMDREGSVTYFIIGFELLASSPYSLPEIKTFKEAAKGHNESVQLHKQQQIQQKAAKQIANKNEGRDATLVNEDNINDICFD